MWLLTHNLPIPDMTSEYLPLWQNWSRSTLRLTGRGHGRGGFSESGGGESSLATTAAGSSQELAMFVASDEDSNNKEEDDEDAELA